MMEYIEGIRYCDGFVICLQSRLQAERRILKELRERLYKFDLEFIEDKTRIIRFGGDAKEKEIKPKTFDFLGTPHYCSISHRGKFMVGRRTSRKKFR